MAAIAVSSPKSTIFRNPISLREPSSSLFGGSLKGFCFQLKPRSKSRKAVNLVVSAPNCTISGSRGGGDRFYTNFTGFPFPLGPFLNRSATRTELLKELGAPVEYIVLPTFAYEHKILTQAQVRVAPRQWSWPLNLPLEFIGIFRAKTLKDEDFSTSRADEIEQKVLSSPEVLDYMWRSLSIISVPELN
ncbi:uncharacterized protein [Pyrus communis]|uniref:uncharacterized protein n=1 Tax=Pyrus communis TaxID=23211 RepID=UPI0035C03A48